MVDISLLTEKTSFHSSYNFLIKRLQCLSALY